MDAATFTTTAVGYDAFVCQFSVCPSIEMMHDTIFPIRYAYHHVEKRKTKMLAHGACQPRSIVREITKYAFYDTVVVARQ